jgi:para-nitrobenzyl esterase
MRTSAPRLGFSLLICLALLAGCGRGRAPRVVEHAIDPNTKRTISSGELVGFEASEKSQGWLGIPYAAPPVGDLRWRPPHAVAPWSGTREALRPGSPCPQIAGLLSGMPEAKPGSLVGNEDCLYLNVYAPRASVTDAKLHHLPVMFWIHGGGNTIGRSDGYDGSRLAETYDVVVVTVNYRLGPFGWFRHPAITADAATDDARSGNWGTLDLIHALKWVHSEIGAFGGDPGNVTIFGESAGGVDVYSLLVSPRAAGLFQRAISESGGLNGATIAKAENAASAAEPGDPHSSAEVTPHILFPELEPKLAQQRVAALSQEELASKLRAASPEAVFAAYRGAPGTDFGGMLRMPLVIRDGAVLPHDEIEKEIAEGHYNQVPFITGTNRDELKLFMFGDRRQVSWWFGFLPRIKDVNHYDVSAEYGTMGWKMGAVDTPARDMRNAQGPSVYAYRFDWDEEPKLLWSDFGKLLGAAHGLEIPFVFKNFGMEAFERMWTEQNRAGREELADAMSSYWTQFAYSGSPGRGRSGELPEWKPWDNADGADKLIIFDTHAGGGIRMEREAVTKDSLLAKLASDPRMDDKLRCEVFQGYLEHDAFTNEDLAKSGCKNPVKDVAER